MSIEPSVAVASFLSRGFLGAGLALVAAATGQTPQDAPASGLRATPLQSAVPADGARFHRLEAARTGVTFRHELKKENTFTYLTNGSGLAVGDYDQDGLPDLYLVSQDGPNRLYRQTAPLRFEDVTQKAGNVDGGEAWGSGAVFCDLDGDGWLDLYVCNMEAKNLFYRNRGDGTFEECAARFGLDIGAASTMAAPCDYDRDGDLDLYLLTNRALHASWAQTPEVLAGLRPPAATLRTAAQMVPTLAELTQLGDLVKKHRGVLPDDFVLPEALREHFFVFHGRPYMAGQPDRILRNDGGRFTDVTKAAGIVDQGMGLSASWWDYDQDGWPDLYVANDLESPDVLYRNRGDGTFANVTAATFPHTAYYGMGSDSGDIDNDGRIDFLVADMSATTHKKGKILMGNMDRQRDFLIHAHPQQYMRNALFLNTGTGRFQEIAAMAGCASTDWTWSVLFGDLDNDGFQDLYATNGIARFDMNPDLEIKVQDLYRQKKYEEMVRTIQEVPGVPEAHLALRNTGALKFEKTGADWGLDLVAVSQGAALVDLDRDGDLDVVCNNFNGEAAIWANVTSGRHAIAVQLQGRGKNRFGLGARVEVRTAAGLMVRELWAARGYLSGQEPRLHFGLGAQDKVRELAVRWPSGRVQTFADLAADQLYTITEPDGPVTAPPALPVPPAAVFTASKGPAFTHRERPFDDYAQEPLLPHRLSQLGPGIAFGDADGDGDDDVFVGGAAGQPGQLLIHDQADWRQARGPWEAYAESEDMGVLWFDYDGDGDQDLLVISGGVESKAGDVLQRDRLYRNDGNLQFVHDDAALPDLRESGSCACAADFDRDGDLDLFVGGRIVPGQFPDAPPSRLLRNDGGRFTDVTADLAPALLQAGMVTSAVWSDVDGDGDQDLLVAALWQSVRLLRNEGGRFLDATETAGLAGHRGWWNSLATLDADGDGDLDVIVGNVGRNTKYKANPEHPTGLCWSDFDGNGTRDLVETKYEGERLLPVRGRSCSSQAMPFLAEKFPTFEKFASSTLGEIYPADKLQAAGTLTATCLDSVLLRNDGKGNFTVEPLPWIAQAAPIFGLAVADFDGDGRRDVVCGQNFFAPEPETGHFDGGLGLLLRGTPQGLAAVPPAESGIVAFGDHKGVATADLGDDGHPGVVFAPNDAALQPFGGTRAPQLVVELAGGKGNPTAVGARVTAVRKDGTREVAEVTAGQGYLSQSSALLLFAGAIEELLVRWPDGTETRAPVAEGAKRIRLAQ